VSDIKRKSPFLSTDDVKAKRTRESAPRQVQSPSDRKPRLARESTRWRGLSRVESTAAYRLCGEARVNSGSTLLGNARLWLRLVVAKSHLPAMQIQAVQIREPNEVCSGC
jgi:hypothetical protein